MEPWNFYDFPFSWECHHPNWRTHTFQRDWNHQPVSFLSEAGVSSNPLIILNKYEMPRLSENKVPHSIGWLSSFVEFSYFLVPMSVAPGGEFKRNSGPLARTPEKVPKSHRISGKLSDYVSRVFKSQNRCQTCFENICQVKCQIS